MTLLLPSGVVKSTSGSVSFAKVTTVTATVANGPGTAQDWVGLFATSATGANYVAWQFLNGLQSPPATGSSGASLTFTLPATPGTYNVRFFQNNTLTLLATSGPITVP